jgi:hypothetical protein
MLSEEIVLNILYSGLASVAFFYVYKKSKLIVMLLAGILTYIELLARVLNISYSPLIGIQGINILMIPELLILIYMIWYTWRDGFNWIPVMITGLLSTFLILIGIGHTFYGDIGVMFGLICIIWVNQSCTPCNINPFECNKIDADRCNMQEHSRTIDAWRKEL